VQCAGATSCWNLAVTVHCFISVFTAFVQVTQQFYPDSVYTVKQTPKYSQNVRFKAKISQWVVIYTNKVCKLQCFNPSKAFQYNLYVEVFKPQFLFWNLNTIFGALKCFQYSPIIISHISFPVAQQPAIGPSPPFWVSKSI
jgi:hypothetical protein